MDWLTDSDDIPYISPDHFWLGRPLNVLPETDVSHLQNSPLSKWRLVQEHTQYFWSHWSTEYLLSLQAKSKWLQEWTNLLVSESSPSRSGTRLSKGLFANFTFCQRMFVRRPRLAECLWKAVFNNLYYSSFILFWLTNPNVTNIYSLKLWTTFYIKWHVCKLVLFIFEILQYNTNAMCFWNSQTPKINQSINNCSTISMVCP